MGLCAFQRLPLASMPGCVGCCYLSPALACCHCMVPPALGGGSTGQCMLCGCTVPLPSLHVLAWLPLLHSGLGMPCIVIMLSPWVSALSCHSSVFGTCILAALVCIPCMLVPVPLATTGRTLHALEPGLGGRAFGCMVFCMCCFARFPSWMHVCAPGAFSPWSATVSWFWLSVLCL